MDPEKGIPGDIRSKHMARIMYEANSILENYSSGFTLEKKESSDSKIKSIDIRIKKNDGKQYSINSASGYEKFAASMSIRLCMMKLYPNPMGRFMILDEVATACDEEQLPKFIDFLKFIKNEFDFIMIISHLDRMKRNVEREITITIKDKLSYINNTNKSITAENASAYTEVKLEKRSYTFDDVKNINLDDPFEVIGERYYCKICIYHGDKGELAKSSTVKHKENATHTNNKEKLRLEIESVKNK